jgi:hypothetical protein
MAKLTKDEITQYLDLTEKFVYECKLGINTCMHLRSKKDNDTVRDTLKDRPDFYKEDNTKFMLADVTIFKYLTKKERTKAIRNFEL